MRLTDEQLAELLRVVVGDAHVAPIHYVWVSRMLDEIRERRAADLTDEEREALRFARNIVNVCAIYDEENAFPPSPNRRARCALVVLDKLLGGPR